MEPANRSKGLSVRGYVLPPSTGRLAALSPLLGLEKPHFLDGDHGLVGKRLHQFDLPLREPFDTLAYDRERTDTYLWS